MKVIFVIFIVLWEKLPHPKADELDLNGLTNLIRSSAKKIKRWDSS